jgi:hypothetical protein
MVKLLKWSSGLAALVGLFFGMTHPTVIEASPEPLRSALQQLRADFAKTAAGKGFEGKPEAGGGGDSGGIPLLRNNGVSN